MEIIPIRDYIKFLTIDESRFYPQQVGTDLSLKKVSRVSSTLNSILRDRTIIDTETYLELSPESGFFHLLPGTYSFSCEQGLALDNFHFAKIIPRSSLVRCGGFIGSGIYEPGFVAESIGFIVLVTNPLRVEVGARVCQIEIYSERDFGIYSGQWTGERDIK